MKVWFGDRAFDCDAIAFDKDGTLVDREAFWQALYDSRIKAMEGRLNHEVISAWEGMNGLDDRSANIDPDSPFALGTFEEEKVVLATAIFMVERIPWDQAIDLAAEILTEADGRMTKSTYIHPLPGVPETLFELAAHGLLLCVLTADIRKRTVDTIQELNLEDVIGCIVTPAEVEQGKPAPDMIFYAAQELDVAASKMAMVGDSISDLKMARAAGAFAVAVSNEYEVSPEVEGLSDSTIRTIVEIRV